MTLDAQLTARAHGSWSDIRGHLEFIRAEAAGRPALAELGVRTGNSTCALLAAIEAGSGRRSHLWSVDVNEPQVPASWHSLPYWHFLQADDLSEPAQQHLPRRIDLLLIDTSHEQGHTLAELELYVPRVTPGGVVLCHDTHWAPGDIELPGPEGPVARALDMYCRTEGLVWSDRPGSYGMGVIRIPEGRL